MFPQAGIAGTGTYIAPYFVSDPGYYDSRCLLYSNGTLYGTDSVAENYAGWNTVFSIKASTGSYPKSAASTNALARLGVASTTRSPWNFIFENTTSLYIAVDDNITSYNVLHWTSPTVGGAWMQKNTISFSTTRPVYSIAGRYLYNGAFGVPPVYSTFVLYAATSTSLFSHVPATGVTSLFYTPPSSNHVIRGVVSAPYAPTGTSTSSPTVTPTKTGTPTKSGSPTSTSTGSASPSTTASPSSTPSASNSASMTASSTGTPQVNYFQPSALIVVRLGDDVSNAQTAGAGVAQPVYLDEWALNSDGSGFTVHSSTALPSTGSSSCTLATGIANGSVPLWAYGPVYYWCEAVHERPLLRWLSIATSHDNSPHLFTTLSAGGTRKGSRPLLRMVES